MQNINDKINLLIFEYCKKISCNKNLVTIKDYVVEKKQRQGDNDFKLLSVVSSGAVIEQEDFFDKDLEHGSCNIEVCNNAVFKRSYCNDGTGSTADNFLCFLTNVTNGIGTGINSNNGRFAHDYAFSFGKDKGVCGTKVDTDILIKKVDVHY